MEIEEIKAFLPHRYPFLLVDRVEELEENRIVTLKNLTINEDFFNGHFPGAAVMPGVLQIEAMAQSGCLMMLKNKVDSPDNTILVFSSIHKAKFRKPVVPGDQLRMEVELIKQRRNFLTMSGLGKVNDEVACELEASAALLSKQDL